MAKPTGTSGPFRATVDQHGSVSGSFERIAFPESKDDVEDFFASRFIHSMNKHLAASGEKFILANPVRNVENDFDFTATSPNGPAYLELLEAAPLTGKYESAPATYKPYDYAQFILGEILKKSAKYPKAKVRDIFLLVYVTHWTFVLSETTVACLRYWLSQKPTAFRAIFCFSLFSAEEGTPRWLSPVPPELIRGFNPEAVRENVCHNLDPRKTEVSFVRNP
jgi:hypothetical protein